MSPKSNHPRTLRLLAALAGWAGSASAMAQTTAAPTEAAATPAFSGADTAWMLISTVLVMLMTMPGIILFYSGMLRSKNALSIERARIYRYRIP